MDKIIQADPRKMREGECRTTRKGARYCRRGGKVRFVRKGR